jgi:hypothetical protein
VASIGERKQTYFGGCGRQEDVLELVGKDSSIEQADVARVELAV